MGEIGQGQHAHILGQRIGRHLHRYADAQPARDVSFNQTCRTGFDGGEPLDAEFLKPGAKSFRQRFLGGQADQRLVNRARVIVQDALSTGIGSQVQKPLALVVVGGILLAPVLILIVLPVLIDKYSRRAQTVADPQTTLE